jgi:hypothetical protein
MPSASLLAKLDPDRYPNMSLTFVGESGGNCIITG